MAQVDINPVRDTYIDSINADTNLTSQTQFLVGMGLGGKAGGTLRTLLEFDLADAGIGAGATIDSAVLNLYVSAIIEDVTGPEAAATLYRLLRQNWEADGDVPGDGSFADWNHYIHDTDSWTTAGAGSLGNDYTADGSVAFTLRNAAGWIQITVTALTQDALDNRGSLLDTILRRDNEVNQGNNVIVSINDGENEDLHPFLDVDYTPAVSARRIFIC